MFEEWRPLRQLLYSFFLSVVNQLNFSEVVLISNRRWKFQLSILENKKVLFLKKYFSSSSQYQNKKSFVYRPNFQWQYPIPFNLPRGTTKTDLTLDWLCFWLKLCLVLMLIWLQWDPVACWSTMSESSAQYVQRNLNKIIRQAGFVWQRVAGVVAEKRKQQGPYSSKAENFVGQYSDSDQSPPYSG